MLQTLKVTQPTLKHRRISIARVQQAHTHNSDLSSLRLLAIPRLLIVFIILVSF